MLRPSAPGLVTAVIALAMDGVYVSLLMAEGDDDLGSVLPFVLLIGAAGLAIGVGSSFGDPRVRASLVGPGAVVLMGICVLAIFSIGPPLLVAGMLALTGALRAAGRAFR